MLSTIPFSVYQSRTHTSEKSTGRCIRHWSKMSRARRAINLQPRAVWVFEKDTTGLRPFRMRYDSVMEKMRIHRPQSLFDYPDLLNRIDLKREVMKARAIHHKAAITLFPEREQELLAVS